MRKIAATTSQWIRSAEACRVLQISNDSLGLLARHGHIRTHQPPGLRRRYLRADVERLAPKATAPGTGDTAGE